ncbi:MAG TPA: ABC transporter permease, partial [Clostridia bacterium]|nr:ABC transporter permease [Clostridia bacterium]
MNGKASIQRSLYRRDRAVAIITVAAMALSVAMLSVMFLIRENSQAFFEHKARDLAGCDMRVNISAKAPLPDAPTPEEAAFLEELQAEGCVVVRTRETGVFLPTPAGYESLVLRISDAPGLAADACILSETAAKRLGLAIGDSLTPKGAARGWKVTGIEPLLSTNHFINAYGILLVSDQSPAAWLEALGVSEPETIPLSIQITVPEGQAQALEDRTRRAFPTTYVGGDEQRSVRALDVEEQTDEHLTVMKVIEMVMLVLTLIGFVLS